MENKVHARQLCKCWPLLVACRDLCSVETQVGGGGGGESIWLLRKSRAPTASTDLSSAGSARARVRACNIERRENLTPKVGTGARAKFRQQSQVKPTKPSNARARPYVRPDARDSAVADCRTQRRHVIFQSLRGFVSPVCYLPLAVIYTRTAKRAKSLACFARAQQQRIGHAHLLAWVFARRRADCIAAPRRATAWSALTRTLCTPLF